MKSLFKIKSTYLYLIILFLGIGYFFLRESRTEIPFRWYGNSIIVEVWIDGKVYNFILDTGAGTTVAQWVADSLMLEDKDSIMVVDYYNNTKTFVQTLLPRIEVGGIQRNDFLALKCRPIQSFKHCDISIDGYLGLDYFGDRIVTIDSENQKLIIKDIPVTFMINRDSYSFEKLSGRTPAFAVKLRVDGRVANEHVILDTGSGNFYYRMSLNTFHKMWKDSFITQSNIVDTIYNNSGRGVNGAQQDCVNYVVQFDTINILGFDYYNLRVTTAGMSGRSVIGSPILKHSIVTIDNFRNRIQLDAYNSKRNIDMIPPMGFYMQKESITSPWIVKEVIENTPVDMEGISSGDAFIQLNEIVLDSVCDCDWFDFNWDLEFSRNQVYIYFKNCDNDTILVHYTLAKEEAI